MPPKAIPSLSKKGAESLPAGKTVICNFLGTGMISVMPVLLLTVLHRDIAYKVIADVYAVRPFLKMEAEYFCVNHEGMGSVIPIKMPITEN